MAISELFQNSASISTTEYSLTNNSTSIATQTSDGIVQGFIDLNAMLAGDEYLLKVLEKISSGGTQRVVFTAYFSNAQAQPNFVLPSLILMHGWDFTMTRKAGADRTIAWSIRGVT